MMKAWQHFKTISTHKMWVMRYCFKIGLYWQGLTHDLSKYSPTEFLVGMKYYQGDRSPNNAEREDNGMSKSWMHHKGRNKHHFEYWIDYGINCDTIIKGVPMPRRYVAEMIMDRISASRVYLGDAYTDQAPYQYLKKGIGHLWFVHPETLSQLTAYEEAIRKKVFPMIPARPSIGEPREATAGPLPPFTSATTS